MATTKLVSFKETTSAMLSSIPFVDGRFIFCTDTGAFYRDTDVQRFLLSCKDSLSLFMTAAIVGLTKLSIDTNIPMSVLNGIYNITTTGTDADITIVVNSNDLNHTIKMNNLVAANPDTTVNIGAVSATQDGLMTSADKTKLDGIAEGANKTTLTVTGSTLSITIG